MVYRALLVGNDTFPDSTNLPQLHAPAHNLTLLKNTLTDPTTGMFTLENMQTMENSSTAHITKAIKGLFNSAHEHDLTLFYYTGHIHFDRHNDPCLCTADTRIDLLPDTALSVHTLNQIAEDSPTHTRLFLFDCSHNTYAEQHNNLPKSLTNQHHYILSNTENTNQTSLYTNQPSPFTLVLSQGLRTTPPQPGQTHITLNDLCTYTYNHLRTGVTPQHNLPSHISIPLAHRTLPAKPAPAASPLPSTPTTYPPQPTPPHLKKQNQKLRAPQILLISALTLLVPIILFVLFSRDNGSENGLKTIDINTVDILHTIEAHNGIVYDVSFSPDSTRIITGSLDDTAKIWNSNTGKLLHTLHHSDDVWNVSFSPDGTRIITGSLDNTAKIWNANTGKLLHTLQHKSNVHHASFSPDSIHVSTASADGTAKIWNAKTGQAIHTLRHDYQDEVIRAVFSSDGSRVVTSSWKGIAKIWKTDTGGHIQDFKDHTDSIYDTSFNFDNTHIITGSIDNTAKIWNAKTGDLLHTLHHDEEVWHTSFSPNGTYLITASFDDTAKIWNTDTGGLLHALHHDENVWNASFSPDSTHAITASFDDTAKIWKTDTGELLHTLQHNDRVQNAIFSPNGISIVSTSSDGIVKVWKIT